MAMKTAKPINMARVAFGWALIQFQTCEKVNEIYGDWIMSSMGR